jgi:AraC-like DNA-binding protein
VWLVLAGFDRMNFQILTIFRGMHKAGYFKVKPRPFAALSLRLRGMGAFYINGEKLISNAGDLLYIPADVAYEVEYSVNEIIVVHLSECNYHKPFIARAQNQKAAEMQFYKLLDAWTHNCSVYLAKSYIYSILDMFSDHPNPASEQDLFCRCVQYMQENFSSSELNIETVCEKLFVSRSTLQRIFCSRLGMSPHQYLTKLRVERSLILLASGQSTIKEVAYACGFSDEKYFSVIFKKIHGYSPSYLRNNLKM